jgi:hypothetical protein
MLEEAKWLTGSSIIDIYQKVIMQSALELDLFPNQSPCSSGDEGSRHRYQQPEVQDSY